jgi:hypothetical protein
LPSRVQYVVPDEELSLVTPNAALTKLDLPALVRSRCPASP